jgi:hypothetical protein
MRILKNTWLIIGFICMANICHASDHGDILPTSANSSIYSHIYQNTNAGDEGIDIRGELHVGEPNNGKESVFGEGDSFGVELAFHATVVGTTGFVITGAIDVTEELEFADEQTAGLFGGVDVGDYNGS